MCSAALHTWIERIEQIFLFPGKCHFFSPSLSCCLLSQKLFPYYIVRAPLHIPPQKKKSLNCIYRQFDNPFGKQKFRRYEFFIIIRSLISSKMKFVSSRKRFVLTLYCVGQCPTRSWVGGCNGTVNWLIGRMVTMNERQD